MDAIRTYLTQLEEILSRKFSDHSLLLGFNASVQAKIYTWIVNDLDQYLKHPEMEFDAIGVFDKLWTDFHYPIIKFFQQQHAVVFEEQNRELKKCQKEGRPGEFKVRPVEMRKINDNFMKYIKEIYQFYGKLLKYFTTKYKNPNIPDKFLEEFRFTVSGNAIECQDDNFLGHVIHLSHKCCLCLGDMLRNQAFIDTNYVVPCLSNKEFFKFKSLPNKRNHMGSYVKAIQYYNLCIMLIPALSEPYNQIGVIYNSADDKFNAIYWFLRSHFSRLSEHQLGFANMSAILKKHWFTTALVDIVNGNSERRFSNANVMNVFLVCLLGYIYCPERYKNGPNIVKKIPFSKIETDLFKMISSDFDEQVVLKHLVVMFGIVRLTREDEQRDKLLRFAFRYVEKVLVYLKTGDGLMVLRFILNLLRENAPWLQVFTSRRNCVVYLTAVLKRFASDSTTRPTRMFFFEEDVNFRDCSLIKYQFKDFNDEALFSPYIANMVVGDYSKCDLQDAVDEYVERKRTDAVVVLGKKILSGVQEKKEKKQEKQVTVPATIQDIQLMISKQNKEITMDIGQGLEKMVDQLVADDDDW